MSHTNSIPKFACEIDASRQLLEESTTLLLEHGVDFVVVGGWPVKSRWRKLVDGDGLFNGTNSALLSALNEGKAIEKITAVLDQCGHHSSELRPTVHEIRRAFDFLVS